MNHCSQILEQLPCIISGAVFNVTITRGISASKKLSLSIDNIKSEHVTTDGNLAVPVRFQHGVSSITMDGAKQTANVTAGPSNVRVRPTFSGLPGLEEQLEQLSRCVERINRQVDKRYAHLAGCVPILLHGSTGKVHFATFACFSNALRRYWEVCNLESIVSRPQLEKSHTSEPSRPQCIHQQIEDSRAECFC